MNGKRKAVIVTGCHGGIGRSICEKFKREGIITIGLDIKESDYDSLDYFFQIDLHRAVFDQSYWTLIFEKLAVEIEKLSLIGLINNAAVQILGHLDSCTVEDFRKSLDINVTAPFLLSKNFARYLEENYGCILNIGSIHAEQTKPEFVAYAASKGALKALTKALAVDIGDRIRVNAIEPAAIATDMLLAGFKDRPSELRSLEKHHPSKCIGSPDDVADLAYYLITSSAHFLNGAVINMDGGISSRLHDPL